MDVEIVMRLTIKKVNDEIFMLSPKDREDCLKIMVTDGLKKLGYKSEISEMKVDSVKKTEEEDNEFSMQSMYG